MDLLVEQLREAVVLADRVRPSAREAPDTTLDLWLALVAGRWSLIASFDRDGRRFLVAARHDGPAPLDARLTERELDVCREVRLGSSNKVVADALGLSTSTVATHIASAQAKLRAGSRVALIATIRALEQPPSRHTIGGVQLAVVSVAPPALPAVLTPAEREVFVLAMRGDSDREIAAARGTSARTIANQLRAMFAKLGVTSRYELVAKVAGAAPAR